MDIVNVAREPGVRSKIAVNSSDSSIEAVGACVGPKGTRVQNIMNEIGKERVDIIEYSDDQAQYIENALSPAKIEKIVTNDDSKRALIVVDDDHLSLAIGKEGVNVRLAAKLTGWRIDIKSISDYKKLVAENPDYDDEYSGKQVLDEPELFLDDDLFVTDSEGFDDESITDLFE